MAGKWVTGEEIIFSYGKLSVEIGQACYQGELQAHTRTGLPIHEASKVAKIPALPPDNVMPEQHCKYGIAVSWDWPAPYQSQPASSDGKDFSLGHVGIYNISTLALGLCELKKADCVCEIMKYACLPYVEGKTLTSQEMFSFAFPDFERETLLYAIKIGKRLPEHGEAFRLYETMIKNMLFLKTDVARWLSSSNPQANSQHGVEEYPTSQAEQSDVLSVQKQEQVKVNIPASLWAGKISSILPALENAVKQYEVSVKRKNDALPRRMKLLFRNIKGEHFSDLQQDSNNLSRDLKQAKEKDLPKLLRMFSDLFQ